MKQYDPSTPLISIHVPKTGGTSFRSVLALWFRRLYTHYETGFNKRRMRSLITKKYKRNVCIHGHFNWYTHFGLEDEFPDIQQYLCFLRNPLELQLSTYYFKKQQIKKGHQFWDWPEEKIPDSIDQFLEKFTSNITLSLPRDLKMNNFPEIFETQFVHVGVLEHAQRSCDIIADKLGKPRTSFPKLNTVERTETPSTSAIRTFQEKSELEYALYEYALNLNK